MVGFKGFKEGTKLLHHPRRENASVHTGCTFIVMRGFPGTGKSTIARLLAAALHASLIDRDIIRQTAVRVFGELPQVGQFSYELMFALAREQLSLGLVSLLILPLPTEPRMNNAKNWRMLSRHLCWLSTANAHLRFKNAVSKVAKGTFQHFKLLPGMNGSSGNLVSRNMRMVVAPLIPLNQWTILWQM